MAKFFDPVNYGKHATHNITIHGNVIILSGTSGTANITINGYINPTALSFSADLDTTAINWVTNNYAYYYALGYIVSALSGVITINPRYSWDSYNRVNVTIANVTPNITGTLYGRCEVDFAKARNWRITFGQNLFMNFPRNAKDGELIHLELIATGAYSVNWTAGAYYFAGGTEHTQTSTGIDVIEGMFTKSAAARADRIDLAGTGTANITAGGLTKLATYNGSIGQTVIDFVAANAAAYLQVGLVLTGVGGYLLFTVASDAANLFAFPVCQNVTGTLYGINTNYPEGRVRIISVTKDLKQ